MSSPVTDKTLLSLPTSVKQQLERAQSLLDQAEVAHSMGDRELTISQAVEAIQVIRGIGMASPELGTLLVAGKMGHLGYELETFEHIDNYQVIDRKFLGITTHTEVVNVPKTTRRSVRGRFL
ncbi:MAG: hypothetical protein K1X67_24155 [Fimbriimonadaceae bacterium]|nr:hypothetical protein [Fimbriimonadaceae bacterium]